MSNIDMDLGPDLGSGIIGPRNDTTIYMISFAISTLGLGLSSILLLLMITTAVLFAEWRRSFRNQILLQLMLARYGFTLVRYFYDLRSGLVSGYDRSDFWLQMDLLLRFYTEMLLVAWMYAFTKHMYDSLVKVFNVEHPPIWKVSIIAWLTPLILTILLYVILFFQSNKEFQILFIYVVLVKWPVLVSNGIYLVLIIRAILKTNKSRTENNKRMLVVMIILIFSFCFQQFVVDVYRLVCILLVFHLYSPPYVIDVVVIIFNLASLYYCAFSIGFWLFGNKSTRELWKFQSKKKQRDFIAQNSINSRLSMKA